MQELDFRELREQNALSVEEVAHLLGVNVKTIYRWENGEIEPKKHCFEILRDKLEYKKSFRNPHPDFRFIDLFAGIGGIRRGFEAVGGKCIYTCEWDEYAQRTYRANFHDDHHITGDITKVNPADIPKHEVLLAGFPCQPFSIAGVSKKKALGRAHGFEDKTQGTLFYDVLRILEYHEPRAFLLENVKNLKNHNKGDTFKTIMDALHALGYHTSVKIIDAKGYVPQHRERIFIVGFRNKSGFNFDKLNFVNPQSGPALGSILHDESEEPEGDYTLPAIDVGSNTRSFVNPKYTLTDKLWEYLQNYAKKHKAAGNGFGYGLNGPEDKARTLSARYYKDGSEILIRQDGMNPRRLTPRECARLMGYDKGRKSEMIIPVSDTRAYKQFGNSVVVPVIEAIARHMKPFIVDESPEQSKLLPDAAE
ncbi:DNA (cytosine-5-)-methyltransferase [uncultured Sneathiella sp.]|uniref:DNA (cytosine-5-)-methyltransferase n=1 Tax=uncultured Sneathiella sp. TaxID=879315 RepID=UPI0030D6EDE0